MKGLSYRMLVIILGIAVAILVAFTTIVSSGPNTSKAGIAVPAQQKVASDIFRSLVTGSHKSVKSR